MLVLLLTRLLASGLEWSGVSTLRPLLLLQLIFLLAFLVLGVTAGPWSDTNATLAIHRGYVRRRGDGGAERARADLAKEQPNDGSDDDECHPLDAGSRRAAGRRDAAKVAKARNRAIHTMPVIVGVTIGCGLGAASEASAGLWSVVLPTGLALLAFAMGLADEHAP